MAATYDLEALAETCLATAKTIKSYIASNGLPQMSFNQDGPSSFPSVPVEIQQARSALQVASKALHDLVTGPDDYFKWTIMENLHDLNVCRYIYHWNIAEAVPIDKEVSFTHVAAVSHVDESQLKQVLRHAITGHIFCEPRPGYVAHTAASRMFLAEGPKNVIGYITEEAMPTVNAQTGALEKWGHGSSEANESAWSKAFDTKMPVFQFYKQDPVRGPRFAKSMHYLTKGDAHSMKHVVEGFDWLSLGKATVVDLAGSLGHASVAVAEAIPELKFIVQDLPNVIGVAQNPASTIVPQNLRDRISFQAHDFFQPQPVEAECYFLRFTLHVYADKYAVKILQALSPALKPGSRVVIMDQVMPEVGAGRNMTAMNLQMMATFNARERSMSEWEQMMKDSDSRFKIKNVITPPGSVLSVIEVVVE